MPTSVHANSVQKDHSHFSSLISVQSECAADPIGGDAVGERRFANSGAPLFIYYCLWLFVY